MIITAETKTENRVIFFDNLRYLLILFVILEHSSNAYNKLIWWPVADKNTSLLAEWVSSFSDAFAMPLLFFIAGYFAIPTLAKKGTGTFVKGKLRRLGIPWLVCILTICPILPLIYHYTRDNFTLSTSYWDLWVALMKNALHFNVGIIPSMNELMMNNQFYQRYMWFLSLLLLFFLLLAMLCRLKGSWFDRVAQPLTHENPTVFSTLKVLVTVGFLTAFGSFLILGLVLLLGPKTSNPEPLFTLGNIIQFRPSRLFLFVIYFAMGILVYRNRWMERGKFPGHFMTWIISFILFLTAYLCIRTLMLNAPKEMGDNIYGPLFFFILNFLAISTLGCFSSLGVRYWNRPKALDGNLASNSYSMYLSHYLFVLALQLILLTFPLIPGAVKFGIVAALSIFLSYLVSQFLLKPFPRIAIAAAIMMCMIMAMIIRA